MLNNPQIIIRIHKKFQPEKAHQDNHERLCWQVDPKTKIFYEHFDAERRRKSNKKDDIGRISDDQPEKEDHSRQRSKPHDIKHIQHTVDADIDEHDDIK